MPLTQRVSSPYSEFLSRLLDAVGVAPPENSISPNMAWASATAMTTLGRWARPFFSMREARLSRYMVASLSEQQVFNLDAATEHLGYEPPVSLDDAISRTAEYYNSKAARSSAQSV